MPGGTLLGRPYCLVAMLLFLPAVPRAGLPAVCWLLAVAEAQL